MSGRQIEDLYPLSPTQAGMVFHALYEPTAGIYQVQVGYRIEGPLDEELFERSWNRVLVRHPILRTSFLQDGPDEPLQAVWDEVTIQIDRFDLTALSPEERRRHIEAGVSSGRRPFALDQPPLMRLALFRESGNSRVLLWGMHHALLDGWSKSVVLADVFAEYEAALRGGSGVERTPRVFRDYIVWLEAQKDRLSESEAFWRDLLKGFSAGTRLLAFAVPAAPPNGVGPEHPEAARRNRRLTTELTERIRSFARRERTTLNLVLQAAWAALLSRYTGEADLVFGATVSTRPPSLTDSASIVGPLINTVPVRVRIGLLDSFRKLIDGLRRQQADRSPHEAAPLTSIQAWSEIPRGTQLFESVFVFENFPEDSLRSRDEELSIRREFSVQRSHYAMELGVVPGEELALELGFDGERFDGSMMEQLLKHLEELLEGMLADPDMPIARQRMLTNAEERQVLFEFNDADSQRSDPVSLTRLFELRAESDPDATAIVDGQGRMTYGQLDQSANRLARYLTACGVGPETLVGLQAGRGAPMIVAVLGILKAGGAYLPIDPSYPAERRRFMIEDSDVRLILTDRIEGEPTSPTSVRTISLDDVAGLVAQQSPATLEIHGPSPRSLAYVLYTSGSSGHPKGVEIEHASAANHVRRAAESFELRRGDRVLQFASLSFDTSVQEIFGALTAGATLFLRPPNMIDSVAGFLAACSEWKLTVLDLPTAYWHEVVASASAEGLSLPGSLRLVVIGGEAALPDMFARWREMAGDRVRLVNGYGPTEASVAAAFWSWDASSTEVFATVPIGRPISNVRIYILDRALQPLPVGVAGDLYIGGVGVARGYRNRPKETSDNFIPDPFRESGERMYKTGDRARWTAAGVLEYLGRADRQIKLRGIRIEPEEIEAALRDLPGVRDAVVRVHAGDAAEARLVGYVVAQPGESIAGGRLRRGLQRRLPAHAVPSTILVLDALPKLPNGKLDVASLPTPDPAPSDSSEPPDRPRTPAEAQLIKIWSSLLGVDGIGLDDNFFDLGGHSLHATRVISRIRDAFRVELSVRNLFLTPTVAGLASAVTEAQAERTSAGGGDMDRLPSVLAASDQWNGEQNGILAHRLPSAGDLAAKKG